MEAKMASETNILNRLEISAKSAKAPYWVRTPAPPWMPREIPLYGPYIYPWIPQRLVSDDEKPLDLSLPNRRRRRQRPEATSSASSGLRAQTSAQSSYSMFCNQLMLRSTVMPTMTPSDQYMFRYQWLHSPHPISTWLSYNIWCIWAVLEMNR